MKARHLYEDINKEVTSEMRQSLFILVVIGVIGQHLGVQENAISPEAVDMDQVRSEYHRRWLPYVFWPSESDLESKAVPLETVQSEIDRSKALLKAVLQKGFQPSEEDYRSEMRAARSLFDDNDWLLLRCVLENKGQLEIKVGRAIVVTFLPSDGFVSECAPGSPSLEEAFLATFISTVVSRLLQIPEVNGASQVVEVHVPSAEIGLSKCGGINCHPAGEPIGTPRFWYSDFSWWSDGRNVSFLVGRWLLENPDIDMERAASIPSNLDPRRPWKFGVQ